MSEKQVRELLKQEATKRGIILFPNPCGVGWVGKAERAGTAVIIGNPRRVEFGLFKEAPDFVGIRKVKITPDMVGKTIGQFVGVETKKPDWRRSKTNEHEAGQENGIKKIRSAGGCAGFVRDLVDISNLFDGEV